MRSIYFSLSRHLCALIGVLVFVLNPVPAATSPTEVDGLPSPEAVEVLDPGALDAPWQALFEAMHGVGRVAAPFAEERTFAFRKQPKRYRGVFRKEADGRISLAYTEPEAMALHLGDGFAYYRKGDGRVRSIPQSNSQGASLALFPKLLNFDLPAIAELYEISGALEGDAWLLVFSAKPEADEVPYRTMRIAGLGTAVSRVELSKSPKQQVVIEMGEPVYPDFYLPQIQAAYFFSPESDE